MNNEKKHTAADFKNARFAEHEHGGVAVRAFPGSNVPWALPQSEGRRSDDEMVISGWSPVHEVGPLSLDALRTAWGNAEQADECRKGDVLIGKGSNGYWVDPARTEECLNTRTVRILSRAPQREPWADLEDVLGRYDLSAIECEGAGELARDLYADGVRVTGGDEE